MKKSSTNLLIVLFFLFSGLAHSAVKPEIFSLDTDHSFVEFKVKHLFSKVSGSFTKFEGTVEYDANKQKLKVSGKIDAASIDTHIQKRDDHLRSADFFDVANHKFIFFEGSKFSNTTTTSDETRGKLTGKITIRGVTKDLTLDVVIHSKPMIDPWGYERVSISATGMVNRKDFGLNWNKAIETGGFVVGDDVEISIESEAVRKPATAPTGIKKSS